MWVWVYFWKSKPLRRCWQELHTQNLIFIFFFTFISLLSFSLSLSFTFFLRLLQFITPLIGNFIWFDKNISRELVFSLIHVSEVKTRYLVYSFHCSIDGMSYTARLSNPVISELETAEDNEPLNTLYDPLFQNLLSDHRRQESDHTFVLSVAGFNSNSSFCFFGLENQWRS